MGVIQICSLAQTHKYGLTCIYTIKCYLLASFKVQWKSQTCSWAQGKDEWCVMRFPPSLFFTVWAGKADPERAGEDGSYCVIYPKCAPGMFLKVILGWLWMDTLGLWQDFCLINWGFCDLPDTWNNPDSYCSSTLLILAFILVCVWLHKIDVQKANKKPTIPTEFPHIFHYTNVNSWYCKTCWVLKMGYVFKAWISTFLRSCDSIKVPGQIWSSCLGLVTIFGIRTCNSLTALRL